MRLVTLFTASSIVALALLTVAPALHAFDATGTWHGKWSCTQFDGTKTTDGNKTSTMLITQTGDTLAINLDTGEFLYNGRALADVKKPTTQGEVVLVACDNDNIPCVGGLSEIIRAKVKTRENSFKATLRGVSTFEDNVPEVGTCKYSFKRDDQSDPHVAACP